SQSGQLAWCVCSVGEVKARGVYTLLSLLYKPTPTAPLFIAKIHDSLCVEMAGASSGRAGYGLKWQVLKAVKLVMERHVWSKHLIITFCFICQADLGLNVFNKICFL
ncbi:hypothetical protein SUGI_0474530, partial [Cryptomeria japonica]